MRTSIWAVVAAILVSASPAYGARPSIPLQDFPNQPVQTASGKKPAVEQVAQAITAAAMRTQWAVAKQADGSFLATRVVKGKHTLVTTISFSPDAYSVVYHSSDNLGFELRGGVPYIHPNYNKWARELVEAIRIEMSKL